jgi:hypothetical protein
MTDLLFESLWFQSSDSTKADPIAQIFCLDAQRFDSLGLLLTEKRIILGVLFPEDLPIQLYFLNKEVPGQERQIRVVAK